MNGTSRASGQVLRDRSAWKLAGLVGLALASAGAVSACSAMAQTAERHQDVAAADFTSVRIIAVSGSLEVRGGDVTEISATGVARAATVGGLENVRLSFTANGSELVIEALTPGMTTSLDLVVTLPDWLPVTINDGSGDTNVANVHSVRLIDGSGDVDIVGVTANVVVGEDGSGYMRIANVGGDVIVEDDGSDDIAIDSVVGSVDIRSDGSGDIKVENVGGHFRVGSGGSGAIGYANVAGNVALPGDPTPLAQHQAAAAFAADETGARLQAALGEVIAAADTAFPGTVVHVSQPGVGNWSLAAGVADTATGRAVEPDARFRAGSVLKPFVAVVVLQLVEEGRLALDQPITEILAALVTDRFADANRITVRMLLNHTSGLPEWSTEQVDMETAANPLRILTTDYVLDIAAGLPPTFQPGQGFAYSNTNYNLLGLIIEEVTGEPWRAAVRERVVDRLGLENTFLPEPGDATIPEPVMHGYAYLTAQPQDITAIDPSMAGAAGGSALVTTAADLVAFLDGLRNGSLFADPATFAQMSDFLPAPDEGFQDGYGLGFEHLLLPGGIEMIGHFGVTAGYFAIVGYFPALDLTVSAAINAWPADPSTVLFQVLGVFAQQAR